MKQFSASSNTRFTDVDGLELIGAKEVFRVPRPLFSLDLSLGSASFTLSAWVERLDWPQRPGALLRKRLPSNPDLSCYAWLDQAEFTFGAHDFYAAEDDGGAWEETVRVEAPRSGRLTHEALVVEGSVVRFYRDGQVLGEPQQLRRQVTDCQSPDPLEVGSENLALYAMKFYPRALPPSQVEEMFREGQPVVELSTGYVLRKTEEGEAQSVKAALEAGDRRLERTLWRTDNESRVTAQALASRDSARQGAPDSQNDQFPPDGAPPPYLPKGAEGARQLNARDLAEWEAGGRRVEGFLEERWEADEVIGGEYWGVLGAPVFADDSELARVPDLDARAEGADGLAVSFWFRASVLRQGEGPRLQFTSPDGEARVVFRSVLDWAELEINYGGKGAHAWQYMTRFDARTGTTDESFLLYAFVQEPAPSVWRHLVVQVDAAAGSLAMYLDGFGVFSIQDRPIAYQFTPHSQLPAPRPSVAELLRNCSITPNAGWDGADGSMAGKIAQLRLYPRMLTPAEVLALSEGARWPSGEAVRQCKAMRRDFDLQDSKDVDEDGRGCEWYHRAKQQHPIVCTAASRKQMCPVTCGGSRLCHDGSLARDDSGRFSQREPRRKYVMFNRTMWLKPQAGSVICPASTLDLEAVLGECERNREFVFQDDNHRNFSWFLNRKFEQVDTADIRDCDVLRERLDPAQCAWDASWMEDFQADFEETGTWSMQFWAKPVEGSLGMPTNFFFAFSFFQRMSPPLMHSFLTERNPTLEPWFDARLVAKEADWPGGSYRAAVWPTTEVQYTKRWTLFHVQMERRGDGAYRLCAALNAMPLDCSEVTTWVGDPRRFLEGFEVSTEMLLSPIELSTAAWTPSEVQAYFYASAPNMDTLLGPRASELDLLLSRTGTRTRASTTYDQRALLLAPPIILQSRKAKEPCKFKVSGPILEKQQELLVEAHCQTARCDQVALEMATCLGDFMEDRFFGLSPVDLWHMTGYADFLAAIGDSEILVRDGEVVWTRNFLDAQTHEVLILAIFHTPGSGISTALEVTGKLGGNAVHMLASFKHLSFVPEEHRGLLVAYCAALITLALVVILMDIKELFKIYEEAEIAKVNEEHRAVSLPQSPVAATGEDDEEQPPAPRQRSISVKRIRKNAKELPRKVLQRVFEQHFTQVLEAVYTILMGIIVIAYGIYCLDAYQDSESRIEGIISEVINGPLFDGTDGTVQSRFQAIQMFDDALDEADRISLFAFCMMILLLMRIITTTNFHPRVGLLTGTLWHSLGDLWHFALLFITVFVCFSLASHSLFGDRREFATLEATMRTQFDILLGALPADYWLTNEMTVYVVFANLTMFFFMLNFLLAIIVEGYSKVVQDIAENQSEKEFFHDVWLSLYAQMLGFWHRWPHKLEWVQMLREDLIAKGRMLSFEDVWEHCLWEDEQGVVASRVSRASLTNNRNLIFDPLGTAQSKAVKEKRTEKRQRYKAMFQYYRKYDVVKCKPMFMALKHNILGRFLSWRVDTMQAKKDKKDHEDAQNDKGMQQQIQEMEQALQKMQNSIYTLQKTVEQGLQSAAQAPAQTDSQEPEGELAEDPSKHESINGGTQEPVGERAEDPSKHQSISGGTHINRTEDPSRNEAGPGGAQGMRHGGGRQASGAREISTSQRGAARDTSHTRWSTEAGEPWC